MSSQSPCEDPHPYFGATHSNAHLTEIWHRLGELQTRIYLGQELPTYYLSQSFARARSVIDLGSGSGHYLGALSRRFPQKRMLGVDRMEPLVACAKSQFASDRLEFRCQDILQVDQSFDFALLRFVVQHLPDPDRLFRRLTRILRPGGSALIIEADDTVRCFVPDAACFRGLFRAYAERESSAGRNRAVATWLQDCLARHPELELGAPRRILIPSTIGHNLCWIREAYSRFIDLVEAGGIVDWDFATTRSEWTDWCEYERAYTQLGLWIWPLTRAR